MLPQNTWCVCFHVHIGGILAFLWFWWHEYLGAVYSLIKAEYERQKTQFHGESVIKGSSPTSDLIFQDGQILKPVKGQIFVWYSIIFFIVLLIQLFGIKTQRVLSYQDKFSAVHTTLESIMWADLVWKIRWHFYLHFWYCFHIWLID